MAGQENNMSVANVVGNTLPGSSKAPNASCELSSTGERRKELRRSYKSLMNETATFEEQEVEEIYKNRQEKKKFGKTLRRAEKLFTQVEESGAAQEALLDAKAFKQFSLLSRNMVDNLNIGSAKFSPLDFAERLSDYCQSAVTVPGKPARHMPDCQSGNENCDKPACHMQKIGLDIQHILSRPMYINYLFGSILREEMPTEVKAKKQRARKSTGDGTGLATQTFVDDGSKDTVPETGASLTEMLVESTMDQLKDAFFTNGSDAIPYFNFILDPTSFGKSVENMFHVSFLIKEGRAKMIVDDRDDGLPYIRPMKEGKSGTHYANADSLDARNQAILGLDMDEWEEMVGLLDITKPMIYHDIDVLKKRKDKH